MIDLKHEWDELREHDNLFLISVRPPFKPYHVQKKELEEKKESGKKKKKTKRTE